MCLRNSQEAREAGAGGGRGEAAEAVRQTEKIVVEKSRKGALSLAHSYRKGVAGRALWTQSRRIDLGTWLSDLIHFPEGHMKKGQHWPGRIYWELIRGRISLCDFPQPL